MANSNKNEEIPLSGAYDTIDVSVANEFIIPALLDCGVLPDNVEEIAQIIGAFFYNEGGNTIRAKMTFKDKTFGEIKNELEKDLYNAANAPFGQIVATIDEDNKIGFSPAEGGVYSMPPECSYDDPNFEQEELRIENDLRRIDENSKQILARIFCNLDEDQEDGDSTVCNIPEWADCTPKSSNVIAKPKVKNINPNYKGKNYDPNYNSPEARAKRKYAKISLKYDRIKRLNGKSGKILSSDAREFIPLSQQPAEPTAQGQTQQPIELTMTPTEPTAKRQPKRPTRQPPAPPVQPTEQEQTQQSPTEPTEQGQTQQSPTELTMTPAEPTEQGQTQQSPTEQQTQIVLTTGATSVIQADPTPPVMRHIPRQQIKPIMPTEQVPQQPTEPTAQGQTQQPTELTMTPTEPTDYNPVSVKDRMRKMEIRIKKESSKSYMPKQKLRTYWTPQQPAKSVTTQTEQEQTQQSPTELTMMPTEQTEQEQTQQSPTELTMMPTEQTEQEQTQQSPTESTPPQIQRPVPRSRPQKTVQSPTKPTPTQRQPTKPTPTTASQTNTTTARPTITISTASQTNTTTARPTITISTANRTDRPRTNTTARSTITISTTNAISTTLSATSILSILSTISTTSVISIQSILSTIPTTSVISIQSILSTILFISTTSV